MAPSWYWPWAAAAWPPTWASHGTLAGTSGGSHRHLLLHTTVSLPLSLVLDEPVADTAPAGFLLELTPKALLLAHVAGAAGLRCVPVTKPVGHVAHLAVALVKAREVEVVAVSAAVLPAIGLIDAILPADSAHNRIKDRNSRVPGH
jgi:hypothetical protein